MKQGVLLDAENNKIWVGENTKEREEPYKCLIVGEPHNKLILECDTNGNALFVLDWKSLTELDNAVFLPKDIFPSGVVTLNLLLNLTKAQLDSFLHTVYENSGKNSDKNSGEQGLVLGERIEHHNGWGKDFLRAFNGNFATPNIIESGTMSPAIDTQVDASVVLRPAKKKNARGVETREDIEMITDPESPWYGFRTLSRGSEPVYFGTPKQIFDKIAQLGDVGQVSEVKIIKVAHSLIGSTGAIKVINPQVGRSTFIYSFTEVFDRCKDLLDVEVVDGKETGDRLIKKDGKFYGSYKTYSKLFSQGFDLGPGLVSEPVEITGTTLSKMAKDNNLATEKLRFREGGISDVASLNDLLKLVAEFAKIPYLDKSGKLEKDGEVYGTKEFIADKLSKDDFVSQTGVKLTADNLRSKLNKVKGADLEGYGKILSVPARDLRTNTLIVGGVMNYKQVRDILIKHGEIKRRDLTAD